MNTALVETVTRAWKDYVQSKVSKGLPESSRPAAGKEADVWPDLSSRVQDREWKQECLKRDEKFDMHMKALVSSVLWRLWLIPF